MPERPDVGRAVSWAFDAFKRSPRPFLALAGVVAALQLLSTFASRPVSDAFLACSQAQTQGQTLACEAAVQTSVATAVPVLFVLLVLGFLAEIGVYRAALATSRGQAADFSMIWRTAHLGRYVLVMLLRGLLILVGLLACIVPGIVLALLMQLAPYYVLDRGLSPMAAIRASVVSVRAHFGAGVLMAVFVFLVAALGSGFYGVLTLVTLPFSTLFIVHMYRQFNGDPVV